MRVHWAVALGAVLAAFAAGLALTRHVPVTANAAAPAVLYYEDPMHPSYRSREPGKAPDCGMDLVPVYAKASAGDGAVTVSRREEKLLGIETAEVREGGVSDSLRTIGRVSVDENRVFPVITKTEGVVRELRGAVTGSEVNKGDVLALVYSRDIQVAQRGYVFALDNMDKLRASGGAPRPEQTQATLDEARLNLLNLGMSERQVAEVAKQRQAALVTELAAPASGVIVSRAVFPDQRYERGMELFRVADLSTVWVVAELFGEDARRAAPGTMARVTSDTAPGVVMGARVAAALRQYDAATRSARVRLEVANQRLTLRPEMTVAVEFPAIKMRGVLAPRSAVLDDGAGAKVFVESGEGVFTPRAVETGQRAGDSVEIRAGLRAGERVAASSLFLLDSESRLQARP